MAIDHSAYLEFAEKYPKRTVAAGKTLVFQSEVPRTAYLLTKGTVRVFSLDVNGDESNINFLQDHAIFPIEYIFEKAPSSLFYYSTATKAEIVAVPMEDLRTAIKSNLDLREFLFEGFLTKYVGAELHIQALEQTRAAEKIIYILQFLVLRFGRHKGENRYEIGLPLKQTDIANMLGVTRETTATELGRLKKSGVITYKSFLYTVDMGALSKQHGIYDWEDIEIS